jgi:AraC family transcriptional regulator, transcriptional activator of pobA
MVKKKQTETVFRHDELSADPAFSNSSSFLPGLSVRINTPSFEHEQFKQHFRSDFAILMLVTKGELSFTNNLKQYTARKGDLVIVSPNAIKQLLSIQPGSTITVIVFTTDFYTRMKVPTNKYELSEYFSTQFDPVWHLNNKDATLFQSLAKQLLQRVNDMEEHPFGKELLPLTFFTFLYEIGAMGRKYAELASTQLSRKENLVVQFVNLVRHQFKEQRSVQQYAYQLNITPKYLTEAVKEITGKTAGEIIDDHVLLEAKLYLHNPEYSISQIADELNFSDQSFFGKFFKRFTGLSPKEYRQSL